MLRALTSLILFAAALAVVAAVAVLWGLHHYGRGLPPYAQLSDYEPPTLTRLHAGDGRLLAEFATEQRVFVPIEAMPDMLVKAFVAAEDQNFYRHPGIDVIGIVRAAVQNLRNLGTTRRLIGASTITQQVAKNFLLTNEVSLERKIKEALLALRVERALSKERILELYLNEIYLGQRAYGAAAAALNYFDKSLDELTLSEMAFLAGLPKAPNNYQPERNPEAARSRRDYVIGRMREDGYITAAAARQAVAEPLVMHQPDPARSTDAPYFAEEVRREIGRRYGDSALYQGGLSVRTTLDPRLQEIARQALRDGLAAYDRSHGWRGPVARLELGDGWPARLAEVPAPAGLAPWRLAVVREVAAAKAGIGFADGSPGVVPFEHMQWARPWRKDQRIGPEPKAAGDVLAVGDVVAVEAAAKPGADNGAETDPALFALRQIPDVEGALVALDPHTGRVLAMVGGWSFEESEFNRATQAARQPGSAFKPFVYLTALENGYTPADIVLDAPVVIDQGPGLPKWRPKNYSAEFSGPSTLRRGVEKSRNLMTVRLAHAVGIEKVVAAARRFGVGDFPPVLSMALGAGETTLLRLATGYAMLVNGGRRIEPALIERIQDRHGQTIYRRDARACDGCQDLAAPGDQPPALPDPRERVTDAATAFQITWILKGVVDRGTGARIARLGRPLGGKTGTTNDSNDAWFMGFAPDLVAGVFVGFDAPRTLGPRQTGASVAAPIFQEFMGRALEGQPPVPFRIPPGVRMVRVDADTGLLPTPASEHVLVEAFKLGTEPSSATSASISRPMIGGGGEVIVAPATAPARFDRGLY